MKGCSSGAHFGHGIRAYDVAESKMLRVLTLGQEAIVSVRKS